MNTYKLLNVYCDACTALWQVVSYGLKMGEDSRKLEDFNGIQMFNSLGSVVRELHDDLEFSLQTDESIEACKSLFWHVHNPEGDESDENIRSYRDVLITMHSHAHDTFQEMCKMRDKYGFEVS